MAITYEWKGIVGDPFRFIFSLQFCVVSLNILLHFSDGLKAYYLFSIWTFKLFSWRTDTDKSYLLGGGSANM